MDKKDGYRQQKRASVEKTVGWRYVVEAFLLYAKLIKKDRQEIIITKGGYLPTHLHLNAVKIFVRIFGLLIYSQVYVYLYVGLIT